MISVDFGRHNDTQKIIGARKINSGSHKTLATLLNILPKLHIFLTDELMGIVLVMCINAIVGE